MTQWFDVFLLLDCQVSSFWGFLSKWGVQLQLLNMPRYQIMWLACDIQKKNNNTRPGLTNCPIWHIQHVTPPWFSRLWKANILIEISPPRNIKFKICERQCPLAMLSTAHAIFCGLQDEVCNALHSLPDSAFLMIKDGLLAVHQKLSKYCYHFDLSPSYIWAACEWYPLFIFV